LLWWLSSLLSPPPDFHIQMQGSEADARSDIFAFGAVLYEMLTNTKAFSGSNAHGIASAIIEREPEPIEQRRPETPSALQRLIRECLRKDPDERWQSAHDLKLQLAAMRDATDTTPPRGRTSRRQAIAWTVGGGALGAAAGLWLQRAPARAPVQLHRTSLLPPPGRYFDKGELSPDGSRVAFTTIAADGSTSLWVRALDAGDAQELAGTSGTLYLFWSPDSKQIGYFAGGKLCAADIRTGVIRVLCEAPQGRGGTWNRDGVIVFAPALDGGLVKVSQEGGRPEPATTVEPGSGRAHRWPWFLPDGRHFLFVQTWGTKSKDHPNGLYVQTLEGGAPQLVAEELSGSMAVANGHLLYVQDNRVVAAPFDVKSRRITRAATVVARESVGHDAYFRHSFSVSQTGALLLGASADFGSELTWFGRDGKELQHLSGTGFGEPKLSPDGRSLAVPTDFGRGGRTLRIYDLHRASTRKSVTAASTRVQFGIRAGNELRTDRRAAATISSMSCDRIEPEIGRCSYKDRATCRWTTRPTERGSCT
jgi:eukaryotic-like serine/threonine-protein kinase